MNRFFRLTPLWTLLAGLYGIIYVNHLYMNTRLWAFHPLFDLLLKFVALPTFFIAPIIAQLMLLNLHVSSAKKIKISRFLLAVFFTFYGLAFLKDIYTIITVTPFIKISVRFSLIHLLYIFVAFISYIAFFPILSKKGDE